MQETESQLRQFEDDVSATLQSVAWDGHVASLSPMERLTHALSLLERSENAMSEIQTLETRRAMLELAGESERGKLAKRQAELRALLDQAGVSDGEAFLQLATVAAERKHCVKQIAHSENQLQTILETPESASWENELKRQFGDHAIDDGTTDLDALLKKITEETRQLRETLDQLRETKGGTDRDLANLRQSDGAAVVAEQIEFARQELFENVNRFVPRLLALRTLEFAIEKFEREQQPETLGRIQRYFAAMTGGRYARVGTRIGGDGVLTVLENDGREKTVGQLSTGTREQLHLAVRLAYIDNFCKTREPLPVVLDDVLVNFDPARQVETLRFFGELSKRMQIIFLTCHDATLAMARQAVPTLSLISL